MLVRSVQSGEALTRAVVEHRAEATEATRAAETSRRAADEA